MANTPKFGLQYAEMRGWWEPYSPVRPQPGFGSVLHLDYVSHTLAGADQRPSSAPFEAPGRSVASRYEPEHRVLGVAAVAVIVLFATENVVRGYLLNLADVVSWWRFATPVFCAFLGIVEV
mgnify:CR=1 FL=1